MAYWTIVHIDRDFVTGQYGNGPTLITNLIGNQDGIYNIEGYYISSNEFKIRTKCNNDLVLKGEPNKKKFDEYHQVWQKWDLENGASYDEDRCDFEPIYYNDIDEIKMNLKCIKE